ncbi:MAG TPA: recombination regulator RecX [Mycobacterium sp.]|nr:recombination regulator RecX [Mycobacterium sp.]
MTRSPRRSTSEPDSGSAADTAADPESAAKRVAQAQNVCLRLLTARARTRAELTDRLTGRGYSDDVIATVLGRLERAGLLDDAEFAREWVRSRQEFAGKGKRALAVELRNKGVDAEIIAEALAGIDADTERRRAEELVAARLRRERLADGDEMKITRRLVGMLARRGYSSAMAFDVVSVALAGERERRRV